MNEEITTTNVQEIARGPRKRQTACKLRIANMFNSHFSNGILEVANKKITRVNVIANVVDKYVSESESKFCSLTLDDASSQIRVKAFGDDIGKIDDMQIGDTILIIGNTRFYNDELYISPEIVRIIPIEWLLIRKLELAKNKDLEIKNPVAEKLSTEETVGDKIKKMLEQSEEGVNIDKIILELKHPIEEINSAVSDMLENAEIYEPKPGRIRLL